MSAPTTMRVFIPLTCGFRCDRAQRSDLIARSVPR